jgi:hypothetical protein
MKPLSRIAPGLLALIALAGCQATTFEQSPLAALPCDPAIVGEWHSVGDAPPDEGEATGRVARSGDGEVILRVSADCQLSVEERTAEGPRKGEPTPLFLGEHAGRRYAWTDAGWMMRRFEEDHRPPVGDVHVVRFALEGDRLLLWSTDDKPIAHAIIDGDLKGEVIARDSRLFNRLLAPQRPDVLEREGFFDPEPAPFRKAGDTP